MEARAPHVRFAPFAFHSLLRLLIGNLSLGENVRSAQGEGRNVEIGRSKFPRRRRTDGQAEVNLQTSFQRF